MRPVGVGWRKGTFRCRQSAMWILEHATVEMAASLTLIQGRYWIVGLLNGNLVYRQEPVADKDAANSAEFYLR